MPISATTVTMSGALLGRHGKGMKERPVPLAAVARAALGANLKVRPRAAQDDTLFLSRAFGPSIRAMPNVSWQKPLVQLG